MSQGFEALATLQKTPQETQPQAAVPAEPKIDAQGRSCIYVPISQDGKVVDTQRFAFDFGDD